ncbi:MAG: hypothetical protein AAB870_02135, partial [Patescibacteria group bacterium]
KYHINNTDSSKELLTREGCAISEVLVLPTIPYVFFVGDNHELIALEQTDLNPNRYTLAAFDRIALVLTLADKKTLLIAGVRQGVEGVFELNILE